MSPQHLAALLVAVSFAAGVNVYATVATLGLLARFQFVELPGALGPLASPWIIGAAALLFVVEFFADKVPYFDLVWNALQTFVRVPVAAMLAWAATPELGPGWQLAATAAGGTIAFIAHGGKTAARAAVNSSPEPFSTVLVSLAEDAFVIALTWFATSHPYIAAAVVLVLIAITIVLIRLVIRALRAAWRAMAQRRQAG